MRTAAIFDKIEALSIPILTETEWEGNTILRWAIAGASLVGVALLARIIKGIATGRLKKIAEHTQTKADDALVRGLNATAWFAYLALGISVAHHILHLEDGTHKIVSAVTFILIGLQVAIWCQTVLGIMLEMWSEKNEGASSETAAAATTFLGRLLIWTALTLVILSNLGVEITTVIAGLGVGGVAAALAVQSILSDLFAGLSMYFDRPFEIGDFIIVNDVMGNVRKIGLRTTRIDSLGGEKIVYPNGELTKRFIRNYARMQERRVVFGFGIEYNVKPAILERARVIAREAVQAQTEVRFDRAHFKGFGAYTLDYEVVYYVLSGDFNVYMDKQHAINMEIYQRFAAEGIPFAFPTRTIYTRTDSAEQDQSKKLDAAPNPAS